VGDTEKQDSGFKWWLTKVIIPLIGGGGLIAIGTAYFSNTSNRQVAMDPRVEVANVSPVRPARPARKAYAENENGDKYVVSWSADANCTNAQKQLAAHPEMASSHLCDFTHTQTKIGESRDLFDHWHVAIQAPGDVYEVVCQKGGWQLFEDGSNGSGNQHPGTADGKWGHCSGYINGGDDPVTITAYYRMVR
jgi:hypothetical protein